MTTVGHRQDQFEVRLAVNGVDFGIWDTKEGGDIDSEESKHKPGGMKPAIALGGSVEVGNVTLQRMFSRDSVQLTRKTLYSMAGGGSAVITVTPLDGDKLPFGAPDIYTGVLKGVSPPNVDSNSSDAAMLQVEVSTDGTIG